VANGFDRTNELQSASGFSYPDLAPGKNCKDAVLGTGTNTTHGKEELMKRLKRLLKSVVAIFTIAPLPVAFAQHTPGADRQYALVCAKCHQPHDGIASTNAPSRSALEKMTAEAIYTALTTGPMKANAITLDDPQKRAIAEMLAGRPMGDELATEASSMKNQCGATQLGDPFRDPMWNGWGADLTNGRFQPAESAGLTPTQVPNLKLKWAFGFPNATSAYTQPTVVGGRVYVGSSAGVVYSLNASTGCVYWSFRARTGVRSAITVGQPIKNSNPRQYPIYFGDVMANVYAVDAATGKLIWTQHADPNPEARISGAPQLFEGRLFVPVASFEEMTRNSDYPCCTFRGSIVAYDANSGKQIWKSYSIAEEPKPTRKNAVGVQEYGPAGAGIWSSPTIDNKRRRLYAVTGNGYSGPETNTSDAVLALNIDTGKMVWVHQVLPADVAADVEGAPDYDFGASVILRSLPNGKSVLVASSKGGISYGLDPDENGKALWYRRTGRGSANGGEEWGTAADAQMVYVPNVDDIYEPADIGGLFALGLSDGHEVWHVKPPIVPDCTHRAACAPGQSAAITVIPGVVFSATLNGTMRAYSTEDGHVLWQFDTMNKSFNSVNGVETHGGTINGPGPTIVGGMLFMNSGYGHYDQGVSGNALLAFSVD
jgi:polyvinyl alcohol dehydrogenase (cytochrome)